MIILHRSDFIPTHDLFTALDLLPNYERFPSNICDGHADRGRLLPPDTWSCPFWDLHIFYLLRPVTPLSIRHYTSFDIIMGLHIFSEYDMSPNIGVHRASSTGVECQQGTLTPPDTWSSPIWDLHNYVLHVETNPFPEIVVIFPNYALRTSLCTLSIVLDKIHESIIEFSNVPDISLLIQKSDCPQNKTFITRANAGILYVL